MHYGESDLEPSDDQSINSAEHFTIHGLEPSDSQLEDLTIELHGLKWLSKDCICVQPVTF